MLRDVLQRLQLEGQLASDKDCDELQELKLPQLIIDIFKTAPLPQTHFYWMRDPEEDDEIGFTWMTVPQILQSIKWPVPGGLLKKGFIQIGICRSGGDNFYLT